MPQNVKIYKVPNDFMCAKCDAPYIDELVKDENGQKIIKYVHLIDNFYECEDSGKYFNSLPLDAYALEVELFCEKEKE